MRLLVISIALFFALLSPLAADEGSGAGSATSALDGALGRSRSQLRSSGNLDAKAGLRIPSQRSGGEREVGANFDARTDANLSAGGRRTRVRASADVNASAQQRRNRPRSENTAEGVEPAEQRERGERTEDNAAGETNRHVLHADLQLAHRLAEIDRLRDHALAHDDVDLLMRADILEQQARTRHQQHVGHMRVAAEQGRGRKRGFDADVQGENRAHFEAREAPAEGQFDAHGAAYEEFDSAGSIDGSLDAGGESRKPMRPPFRKPRFIPGIDQELKGAIRGESSSRFDVREEASAEFEHHQPQDQLPRPRRTRVDEDVQSESDLDWEYEHERNAGSSEDNQ